MLRIWIDLDFILQEKYSHKLLKMYITMKTLERSGFQFRIAE